jgi:DNA-binding NarL/FixJ family response regulator
MPQLAAPKQKREARRPASPGSEAASNILTLRQVSTAITGVKAEVYRLVGQGLSSYQIAPLVGKSPATIQRWIKARPNGQQEREAEASATDEAAGEATDTAR